jgi:hypothetical protein
MFDCTLTQNNNIYEKVIFVNVGTYYNQIILIC